MSEALKEANVTSELISVLNRCEAAFAILAATGDKNCKELLADIWKAKEAALSESRPEDEKQLVRNRVKQYEDRIPCGDCGHVHLGHCPHCNNCPQIVPSKLNSRSAPDRETLKESLRETLAELKWILRYGSAQRIEPPQATQQVIAEAEKVLAESPSESAPAPEGGDEAQEVLTDLYDYFVMGGGAPSDLTAHEIFNRRAKLPAPEGMGRDAKFELRHHTCEFATNFPDPPIMEEQPYDGTLSDEKGTWRKFMCPICHDRIVIQFVAHPTSEGGTER